MEDINILKEDNFCLKFELDALAEMALKNESERMLPNFCSGLIEHDHKERYNLVCNYSEKCQVLDIACGTGYGSKTIAKSGNAKGVLGCDINPDTIRYAKHRYKENNLSFLVGNAETFIQENSFDLIVSFETIEHVSNFHSFINNVSNNLKVGGTFIVSTPISKLELDLHPINPYHTQEWGFLSFQKEISKMFDIKEVYVQLYQNEFINDKKIESYNSIKRSLRVKLKNWFKSKLRGTINGANLVTDWYDPLNYSILEKYVGQYNVEDLGSKYIGYQILICNKK